MPCPQQGYESLHSYKISSYSHANKIRKESGLTVDPPLVSSLLTSPEPSTVAQSSPLSAILTVLTITETSLSLNQHLRLDVTLPINTTPTARPLLSTPYLVQSLLYVNHYYQMEEEATQTPAIAGKGGPGAGAPHNFLGHNPKI